MFRPGQFISVLMLLILLTILPGCGGDKAEPEESGGEPAADTTGADKPGESPTPDQPGHEGHNHGTSTAEGGETESGVPDPFNLKPMLMAKIPDRKGLAGRWLFRMAQIIQPQKEGDNPQLGERPGMLISVVSGEGDEPGSVTFLAGVEQPFVDISFEKTKAIGDKIEFTAMTRDGEEVFDFEGTFLDGVVIGSIGYLDGSVMPARLVATGEKTLARIPEFDPFDELPEFIKVQQSLVPEEEAQQFVKNNPTSPLSRMALLAIVEGHCSRKAPAKEMESAIQAALDSQDEWGPRCKRQTRFQILQMLEQTGYDAEFSLKYVDDLEKFATDDNSLGENEARAFQAIRRRMKFRQAYSALQAPDAGARKKGRKYAQEVLKELPYNVGMILSLADDLRKEGELDEAISLYAEIKALPMQELILRRAFSTESIKRITPSQRLVELWKRADRKDDLDEYVASIYDQKLFRFMGDDKPVETRPDGKGNLVVLTEIFTSAHSPESVAPDLVASALGKTFPESMFVTLRYHQHTHAPDALANDTSEARCYNFYRLPGAPVLLLNGRNINGINGTMEQTSLFYEQARKMVVDRLSEETEIAISLTANRKEDTIQIQAQVDGADLSNTNLRLRIALAESNVSYTGINGIRKHDMVVRSMPGGELGVGVTDGALKFEGSVDLAELRKTLTEELTKFEDNQNRKFTSKPLELEKLHVVAFVQDDETRKVLQASVVPLNPAAAD